MAFVRSCLRSSINSAQKWTAVKQYHSQAIEETIKVPWGHIAAKRWGTGSSQPVIALHGLFDNAASFDKLIPLMGVDRPILAIDIPGHGKSSNPPPGLSPSYLDILFWLRHLIKYQFKFEKITLLGHSFGSNLIFAYSAIYPEEVDNYVSIDCSKVNMASKLEFVIDDFRIGYIGGSLHKKGVLKEGSYEEFLDYMFTSRSKLGLPLTEEQCHLLLVRDLEEIGPNRYKSLVDTRPNLRYAGRPTLPLLEAMSKRIKCNVLTMRASKGILVGKRLEVYEKHIENMKNNGTKVVSKTVEGGHHVHLENPKDVANLINEFLR